MKLIHERKMPKNGPKIVENREIETSTLYNNTIYNYIYIYYHIFMLNQWQLILIHIIYTQIDTYTPKKRLLP